MSRHARIDPGIAGLQAEAVATGPADVDSLVDRGGVPQGRQRRDDRGLAGDPALPG
jgi:hypothetical protein